MSPRDGKRGPDVISRGNISSLYRSLLDDDGTLVGALRKDRSFRARLAVYVSGRLKLLVWRCDCPNGSPTVSRAAPSRSFKRSTRSRSRWYSSKAQTTKFPGEIADRLEGKPVQKVQATDLQPIQIVLERAKEDES